MTKVSVCISSFNRCQKLERAITSVLMQDYKDIEIVVVDNASNDGTVGYLVDLKDKLNSKLKVTLYTQPEPNAMITLNNAFWNASGKYILVLDDDAYLTQSNGISELVKTMELNPNAAIVGSNVQSTNGMWQMPIRNIDGEFFTPEEISQLDVVHYFEFHGACALFRRDMVMIANPEGPYDESFTIYMNELDLSTKMLTLGFDILFNANVIAYHDGVGDTNACNNRVYHFMKNYNTVITRNFRGVISRLKAVLMHTFMSSGYYYERIIFYKTCPLSRLPGYTWVVIKVLCHGVYRSICPDIQNVFRDEYKQYIFEQSMYNGFKRCIKDRIFWIFKKIDTTTKGVR